MANKDKVTVNGEVVEALPNALFRVKIPNGKIITAHLAGKLRQNFIKVLIGDMVKVEISSYDLDKGRIIFREL